MNFSPNTREKLEIVVNNYKMFGVLQTLREALIYLIARPSPSKERDFDEQFGVSTSGDVPPDDAQISDPVARDNAIDYAPTSHTVFRHILRRVGQEIDAQRFTFIDVGCGKGRILLMASALPFKEVVGVEISPLHCQTARENIEAYRRTRNGSPLAARAIRVCCNNATEFEFPAGDLCLYLFNPFSPAVFREVLARLAEHQGRTGHRVLVILSCPVSDFILAANPAFTKLKEHRVLSTSASWNLWECRGGAATAAARRLG